MTIDLDFLMIFLDEAEEILGHWEQCCLKLEKSPTPADLNALFRAAHNLKGSSRSVGLEHLGKFIHVAEDLITRLQKGEISLSEVHIATLLDAQKFLFEWICQLKSDAQYVPDQSHLTARLTQLSALEEKSSVTENSAFGFFDEPEVKKTESIQLQKPVNEPESPSTVPDKPMTSGVKTENSIRISTEKIDQIIRLAGELCIQQAAVRRMIAASNPDIAALNALAVTEKIVHDLQSESLSLRMLPIGSLFQRMERVCRDVARQQAKPINVTLTGETVELDKMVLEKIKDPLVHILRNAVDHGLEPSDQRRQCGKSEHGNISISAQQTPSFVSIIVSDDGRGLGKTRILKKAAEKGLISSDQKLSEEQILQLIFLPGFSTAEKVTDVSGRGVGMDVVKKAVEELSGSIEIKSIDGRGTTFTINLPSTLSILDAVIIGVQDRCYAIPIQDISEFFNIDAEMIQKQENERELVNLRGEILSLEALKAYLPNSTSNKTNLTECIGLVPKASKSRLALKIDKLFETQSIVVSQVDPTIKAIPGFVGGTILASGEPTMILDLKHIVESHEHQRTNSTHQVGQEV